MSGGAFGSAGVGSHSITPVEATTAISGGSSVALVVLIPATATAVGSAALTVSATRIEQAIAILVGSAAMSVAVEFDIPVVVAVVGAGFLVFDMAKVTVVHQGSAPSVPPGFAKPLTIPVMRQVPPPIHPPALSVGIGNNGAKKRPSGL
jgi:hypothetical protein